MIPTRKTDRMFERAAAAALDSNLRSKHGAVLVRGGKILAVGCNSDRSVAHGRMVPTMHAEVAAVVAAGLDRTHTRRRARVTHQHQHHAPGAGPGHTPDRTVVWCLKCEEQDAVSVREE